MKKNCKKQKRVFFNPNTTNAKFQTNKEIAVYLEVFLLNNCCICIKFVHIYLCTESFRISFFTHLNILFMN